MQDLPFIIDWTEICMAVFADGCCFDDFLFAIGAFFYFYFFRFHFCLPAMGNGCPGHCHIKSVFTPDWCDHPADVCDTKTSLYRSQVFDRNIVLLSVSGVVNISRFWFFVKIHFSNFPSRPLPPAIETSEPVFPITHILNIVKNKNKRSETNSRKNKHFITDFCLPLLNNWRIPFIIWKKTINKSFQFYKLFIFFNNSLQSFIVFLQFRIDIESCRNIILSCQPP